MKKTIILCILAFCFINAIGQRDDAASKVNKSITSPTIDIVGINEESVIDSTDNTIRVKKNAYLYVKITGINKFLYEIGVNSEQFIFEHEQASLLDNFEKINAKAKISKEGPPVTGSNKILGLGIGAKPSPSDPLIKYYPLFKTDLEMLAKEFEHLRYATTLPDFKEKRSNAKKKLENTKNAFDMFYAKFRVDKDIKDSSQNIEAFVEERHRQLILIDSLAHTKGLDTTLFYIKHPLKLPIGDEMDVTVSLTKKGNESNPTVEYPFRLSVYGGFKVDFHTGFVFGFKNPDEEYTYQKVDENSSKIIKEEMETSFTPGMAVFANGYLQCRGAVSPGLSLGIGTEQEDGLNYYMGLSALIGKQQRIVLTAGPSFAKRNKLRSAYNVGDVFDNDDRPSATDLSRKVYKLGGFFGIGYNLGTVRKSISD